MLCIYFCIFLEVLTLHAFRREEEIFSVRFFNEDGLEYNKDGNFSGSNVWMQLVSKNGTTEKFWLRLLKKSTHHFPVLIKTNKRKSVKHSMDKQSKLCLFSVASSLIPHSVYSNSSSADEIRQQIRLASVLSTQFQTNKFLAVSLCSGISGIVQLHNSTSYVYLHSERDWNQVGFQVVSEIFAEQSIPSDDRLGQEMLGIASRSLSLKRNKRASFQMPARQMPGPFLVELYIIVDSKLAHGNRNDNYQRLLRRITSIINHINMAFSQFNIYFTIVQLEIWEWDQIKLTDENHILMELQLYKRRFIKKRHDCLHAIIGENLGSSKRGQAEFASMCGYNSCVGYTKDYYDQNELELSRSVLHEIGHNFGLHHDTEQCQCYGCIMATGVEFSSTKFQWSNCSKMEIISILKSGLKDCLLDKPESSLGILDPNIMKANHQFQNIETQSTSMCGNGVVDEGEQCDCGDRNRCESEFNNCCNPATCQFRRGASCAGGQCCNLKTCSLKLSGTVCRDVGDNSCDLPEYCNGESEWCPSDMYKEDGVSCTTSVSRERSYCYRGSCATRRSQCQSLWGDTGYEANSECYTLNSKATSVENCGLEIPRQEDRDRQPRNWNAKACTPENAICGRLWCSHENERVLRPSAQFFVDTMIRSYHCSAVRFDMDWFLDEAGMVPNGASCGSGKICWKGDCIQTVALRSNMCQCNGHGVCNNRGNCHCDSGFSPPNCTTAGHGGSVDSGPPVKFNRNTRIIVAAVFITLIIILTALIIAVFVYHYNYGVLPPFLRSVKWPGYNKPQKRPNGEKSIQFENHYLKLKRPSVLDLDMRYMVGNHHRSSLYSPKSPESVGKILISPRMEKFKFFEGVQKNLNESISKPELKPKPNRSIQIDSGQDPKSPNEASLTTQSTDSKKPEIICKKPQKPEENRVDISATSRGKGPALLIKKPETRLSGHMTTDLKPQTAASINKGSTRLNQQDKPPPIVTSKPQKFSSGTNSQTESEKVSKILPQKSAIAAKLNEKLNCQLAKNGQTEISRPPVSINKPGKQPAKAVSDIASSIDTKGSSTSARKPAIDLNDKAKKPPIATQKSVEKPVTIGRPMVANSKPTKAPNAAEEKSSRPLKYQISQPKLEHTSNIHASEENLLLINQSNEKQSVNQSHEPKPPMPASQKPQKPHKPSETTKSETTNSATKTKPSKYQISQPRLDQTTCTDVVTDLPSTDKTLTRKVVPHKILKCDPSEAVKYL